MTCYNPLSAWYAAERDRETGKRQITFKPRTADLDQPLSLPCNNCIGCKSDQALMWSIRCYHELQDHDKASFLTLTYNDEHLPNGS